MNKRQKLAKKPYTDLTVAERFQLIKLNKQFENKIWERYESNRKAGDPILAAKYFLMAFELNHSEARDLFASMCKTKSEPCSQEKQPASTPEDNVLMGIRYFLGLGLPKNNDMTDFYIRHAAEMGDAVAANLLGRAYEVHGKAKDAFSWYKLAAEKGHILAQVDTGYAYESATAGERNLQESLRWYKIAAERGNQNAQFLLGRAYKKGAGVDKDENEALRWLLLAYEQGNERPAEELGSFSSPIARLIVLAANPEWSPSLQEAAKHLLNHPEAQRYFLDYELERSFIHGKYAAEDIISYMISDAKKQSIDINVFLTELLLSLYTKETLQGDHFRVYGAVRKKVFNSVNFSQIPSSQLEAVIKFCLKCLGNSCKGYSDFELLKVLWYRAASLEYQFEDKHLLRQIATLLLDAVCNEAHAFRIAPVESTHIDRLFAYLDAKKLLSIEQINRVLANTFLVSPDSIESPVNLLMKLKEYLSDKERWDAFKPFFISTLEQYIHHNLVEKLDETKAIQILEDLSNISINHKAQKQLNPFFKNPMLKLKPLANLLATMDTNGLIQFLDQETQVAKQEASTL